MTDCDALTSIGCLAVKAPTNSGTACRWMRASRFPNQAHRAGPIQALLAAGRSRVPAASAGLIISTGVLSTRTGGVTGTSRSWTRIAGGVLGGRTASSGGVTTCSVMERAVLGEDEREGTCP